MEKGSGARKQKRGENRSDTLSYSRKKGRLSLAPSSPSRRQKKKKNNKRGFFSLRREQKAKREIGSLPSSPRERQLLRRVASVAMRPPPRASFLSAPGFAASSSPSATRTTARTGPPPSDPSSVEALHPRVPSDEPPLGRPLSLRRASRLAATPLRSFSLSQVRPHSRRSPLTRPSSSPPSPRASSPPPCHLAEPSPPWPPPPEAFLSPLDPTRLNGFQPDPPVRR